MPRRKLIRTCKALNCHVSSLQNSTAFYRFPAKPAQKQKWLENLGLTNSECVSTSRALICRRHFTDACIGKRRVYGWAVPTLHLGTGAKEAIHQPAKPKMIVRKCCVRNCHTRQPEILHTFPPKPEIRAKWLEICGLEDVRKRFYICRRHFRPSFLHKHKLLMNAYPELNLGMEDYDPLQAAQVPESIDTDEDGNEDDFEHELTTDTNSDVEEDEDEDEDEETDPLTEQSTDKTCNKCKTHDSRCSEMQEEIDAMRKKITQLEAMVHQNKEDEDEEYIWMLLK